MLPAIRDGNPLVRFVRLAGIGVMSTFMAKGCVDMDAEYCLYTIGLGTKDIPARAIANADLVITLGYDIVEYHPKNWNWDWKTGERAWIANHERAAT
eukprot:SAG31_NODE_7410_length_1696_cov_1.703193_2_plen_97_part_00